MSLDTEWNIFFLVNSIFSLLTLSVLIIIVLDFVAITYSEKLLDNLVSKYLYSSVLNYHFVDKE